MPTTLYENLQGGTILAGNTLASGGTTMHSTALQYLPTVVNAVDVMYVTLDPEGVSGAPEIVKVTSHNAASTAVIVARAQQGTTAREHLPGTVWVHALTDVDIGEFLKTVATANIVDLNVTTGKIADLAVTTGKLNDLAVATGKIAADAVTSAKIADDQIDSEHYVDGSIDMAHLAAAVTDRFAALETLTTPSAWTAVTFQNSWVNYGLGNSDTAYRKVGDMVQLRGCVKSGTLGQVVFTLPVGFRPPAIQVYSTLSNEVSTNTYAAVEPDGDVLVNLGNGYHFLDGISFSVTA